MGGIEYFGTALYFSLAFFSKRIIIYKPTSPAEEKA